MEKHYCPKCGKFIASPNVHKVVDDGKSLKFEWNGTFDDLATDGLEDIITGITEFTACRFCEAFFIQVMDEEEEYTFQFSRGDSTWNRINQFEKVMLN